MMADNPTEKVFLIPFVWCMCGGGGCGGEGGRGSGRRRGEGDGGWEM